MTELLQRAIRVIEQLPADAQDAIAARFLADAEDEQEWSARFEATTDAQWNRMADSVRRAIAAEEVEPLEDAFKSSSPA